MNGVLIDSCVLLDLFTNDPKWGDWSESILNQYGQSNTLYINSIIYTEVSIGFRTIEEIDEILAKMRINVLEIPRAALFLAGKIFLGYRRNKGTKNSPLPDFFIGAHASVSEFTLVTRDVARYRTYFPRIDLVSPR